RYIKRRIALDLSGEAQIMTLNMGITWVLQLHNWLDFEGHEPLPVTEEAISQGSLLEFIS
ncbi:hypothetical protein ACJX0J_006154, partial [Zea mays]